ncbi:MAG: hypothetical protein ACTHM1_11085 [Solirubrobacteraceae bacterium]
MSTVAEQPSDVSLAQSCARFGEMLGLSGPVSERVLAAATQDKVYARNLLATRGAPELMEHLLENPPAVAEDPSALVLAGRAAKALGRFARTGFSLMDEEGYSKRLAACAACPHQIEAKSHATLYRMAAKEERPKVCDLCGCMVAKKARLRSERCPGEDPERPGFNRWGQPRD